MRQTCCCWCGADWGRQVLAPRGQVADDQTFRATLLAGAHLLRRDVHRQAGVEQHLPIRAQRAQPHARALQHVHCRRQPCAKSTTHARTTASSTPGRADTREGLRWPAAAAPALTCRVRCVGASGQRGQALQHGVDAVLAGEGHVRDAVPVAVHERRELAVQRRHVRRVLPVVQSRDGHARHPQGPCARGHQLPGQLLSVLTGGCRGSGGSRRGDDEARGSANHPRVER